MPIDNAEVLKAATALGVVGGGGQTAHRILAALCDPSLGTPEVADIIQRDPGLTLRVLKVANSAYYGRSGQVPSVEQALTLLGVDAVRGIAAAACLDRSVARRASARIQPDALVAHCLAAGLAAEQLARRVRRDLVSETLIAGLLHDFGVLVQERLDPEGVASLIEALREDDARVAVLEPLHTKIGHAQCAGIVLGAWGLPTGIVAAVEHHQEPLAAPEAARDIAALVHLGLQVALDAGFVHPLEPRPLPDLREALCTQLGLDASELREVTERIPEQVLLVGGAG